MKRIGRGLWAVARFILRVIAIVLVVCIACALITTCVMGSIVAVDILRSHDPNYQAYVETFAVDTAKRLMGSDDTDDQMLRFLSDELKAMSASQLETDQALLAELDSGAYSLEAPLIVLNPYRISPLTAVMLFNTPQPARISIHVDGDSPLAAVDYTFEAESTRHIIPVYGLYADRENSVTLSAAMADGSVVQTVHAVQTDRLPAFLAHEQVRATVLDASACQPGFTFTYRGNNAKVSKAALDADGVYRWCLDSSANAMLPYMSYCGNYNGGNSVFIAVGNKFYGTVYILELNLLGKLLNAWYSPYGAHHDIELTEDALWVTGGESESEKEALLYALDRRTGEMTHVLRYADILQRTRNPFRNYPELTQFYTLADWCHMNTVTAHGDDLIVSCRHQNTVVCNDPQGNIKWMLCDPEDYFPSFRRHILTPVGEGFTYFYTQHAPEVMPDQDGNPDTVDILLFDNGDYRVSDDQKASRMVQYRINEREMTVEQIWSYGDDLNALYSYRHGDADLLANGNRLGSFEPHDETTGLSYAYGVEVDAQGTPVWECWRVSTDDTNNYGEYRLERLEIYADSANDLQLGTPAKLFLPDAA